MTAQSTPARRRVQMPDITHWPRVGKIRLGIKTDATTKAGKSITMPTAIDYFRVDPDDEVTSAESAASFAEVYGPEPRVLRCQLPGATPDDVFEGAWRMYGTRKLKRICDGTTCDERGPTGGWDTKPCVCAAQGIPEDDKRNHCALTWTLNVILPDVVGMGVWQIDTHSQISVNRVSAWLQMMHATTGSLAGLEFDLHLSAVNATPVALGGKTTTVYVLDPRAVTATPRQLMEGTAGRASRVAIEAGDVPALPEPTPEPPVAEGEVVDGPPPEGSEEYALAARRLGELRATGASDDEIVEATHLIREDAEWWHLADDDLFAPVMDGLRRLAAGKHGGTPRLDPDDPAPSDPPIPGQQEMGA